MVIYRTSDGKPKYQQVDDLQAAISFVEKLRNEDGLEGSRIFRLEQVNYRFEPYYQVRVETTEPQQAPVPPPPPVSVASGAPSSSAEVGGPPPGAPAPTVDLTASATPAPTPAAAPSSDAPPPQPPASSEDGTETNGVRRGLFGR
jgi:hypothetical protein